MMQQFSLLSDPLKNPCRCAERHVKECSLEQHLGGKIRSNLKGSIHRKMAKEALCGRDPADGKNTADLLSERKIPH